MATTSCAGGEGSLDISGGRGNSNNRKTSVATAGNNDGTRASGSLLSNDTTASGAIHERDEEGDRQTIISTGITGVGSGNAVAGETAGADCGGDGVVETGAPNRERSPTGGGVVVSFQNCEEDDDDGSRLVPEAAAPTAVWQGHLGPVARISSCTHTPCFFTLGEVQDTECTAQTDF